MIFDSREYYIIEHNLFIHCNWFSFDFFNFLKSGELTLLNNTVIVKINRDHYFNNVNTFKTRAELFQNAVSQLSAFHLEIVKLSNILQVLKVNIKF